MDISALSRQFHQRGLLIIEEFLDSKKIAEIEGELRRYLAQLDPERSPDGHVIYEPGSTSKIRNLFHLHKVDPYFAELAKAPQFVELSRAIFNDEPVLLSVELFGKPAQVGSEVPYHQDNAYFNLIPSAAMTCWLALADATEENGCVRYIEGSHQFGNLPHRASGVQGNSMRLSEVPEDAGPEICGKVRRGGVLIHHCNTIHRSEPNRSDRDRPGLLFVYKAASCQKDDSLAPRNSAARELVPAG
jgi:ectoine hydroxylase-related dioxygenase (phytanoyl-CoA dioxygenase family)